MIKLPHNNNSNAYKVLTFRIKKVFNYLVVRQRSTISLQMTSEKSPSFFIMLPFICFKFLRDYVEENLNVEALGNKDD